jgi:hypothetical protein
MLQVRIAALWRGDPDASWIALFRLVGWDDRYEHPAARALAEFDLAGLGGEERVVASKADIFAGVELRAALTDDDVAGKDVFAAKPFHAEALGVRIAAIAR